MENMDTVRIFDTTLRDGEQSPGATLTRPEKLEIAKLLESMGVDIIEAGFPISSNGDFEAVHAIASEIGNSVVCGLARCTPGDIDRAGEAVQPAAAQAHSRLLRHQQNPSRAQAEKRQRADHQDQRRIDQAGETVHG